MPSPFPGMDPWLENTSVFPDLHEKLIQFLCAELNGTLPDDYAAISTTRIYVEKDSREPDVTIVGPARSKRGARQESMVGLKELERIHSDPIEEHCIDIFHDNGKRLVTSIEILSRANKIGKTTGRREYLRKQRKMVRSKSNLVEIDLLRKGRHTTLAPIVRMQSEFGEFDYHISVFCQFKRDSYFVAPISLEERLPKFGVPLDRGVTPILLNLQQALDRAYDVSRYPMFVDYTKQPQFELSDSQYSWAKKILKSKGLIKK